MKKGHVLHIWQAVYPWDVRVAKINRSLQREGYDVTVLARRGKGQPRSVSLDSVNISRVGPRDHFRFLSLPIPGNPFWRNEIRNQIANQATDLILVRDIPLAVLAAKAAKRKKIPVILDMAEHYPEAMRSWKKYSDNPILRKIVHDWRVPDRHEANAVKMMDGILVVCEEQKERLVKEYAYPAEKISVVLNTPELEALPSTNGSAPSQTGKITFGYHGILCQDRELEVILKGFEIAAVGNPNYRLLIAGGGESEQELRNLASTLKAKSQIDFTGRYTPDSLNELYSRADYGIVSLRANIFTEHTLANKFFDYAALGKPFIYPDLAPLRRVMTQMKCGVSFVPGSPESAAHALKQIQGLNYEQMRASGRKAVEAELNWENDSSRMVTFLKNYFELPRPVTSR